MLLLLPPSETKRDGGVQGGLDLSSLGFPELTAQRSTALTALRRLVRSRSAATQALHLGATQGFEIERNRALLTSPVMPAIERYTGVLFDALDVDSLSAEARQFAATTVVIHSALFGLVRADDHIPAYRLSHDSRLPGVSLRKLWSGPVTEALIRCGGLMIDARSESYRRLGPAPEGSWYLRVVGTEPSTVDHEALGSTGIPAPGRRVPLNHANKTGKGTFARALLNARADHDTVDSLLHWAADSGFSLTRGRPGELDLEV